MTAVSPIVLLLLLVAVVVAVLMVLLARGRIGDGTELPQRRPGRRRTNRSRNLR